jgi:hypothetical protein
MVPLSFAPFPFAGQEWLLGPARALVWPAEQALLVADLHLEKASWFARSGQMLPPYDSRETLDRLTALVRHTGARRVFAWATISTMPMARRGSMPERPIG